MRRSKCRFGLVVVVGASVVGVAPLVAAADTWDHKVPVEDWVHEMCIASRAAKRGLDEAGGPHVQPARADASAVRDSITAMLGDFRTYLEGFSDAVREAGVPDIRRGRDLADGMVDALDRTAAVTRIAERRIAALAVDDASEFASRARHVLDAIEAEMQPVIETLSPALGRRYPRIERAKARDPECDGVD